MAKDRRCLDGNRWEVAEMATAETVMAVSSEEHETLESRIRPKDLCPVWGEGWRNLPQKRGKALHPYSTARPVRGGAVGKCRRWQLASRLLYFYNPVRRHSTLDYVSPVQFERLAE
jgi:transposase InsO family protein